MAKPIAEILAKAMNDELMGSVSPQHFAAIRGLLEYLNKDGVAKFWTTIRVSELTALLNQEPPVARFVVGFAERFMMLMHQEVAQEPYLEGKTSEAITIVSSGWWKSVVESIVELRCIFEGASTLSSGMAASLTFPPEDLLKMIKSNYWLVILYLACINGTFINITELETKS